MNEEDKAVRARRGILKRLFVGGGVAASAKMIPDQWQKPVVESVILPAHALTTSEDSNDGSSRDDRPRPPINNIPVNNIPNQNNTPLQNVFLQTQDLQNVSFRFAPRPDKFA